MGIILKDVYPGRVKEDVDDPGGNFLNSSPPGSFTGTPAEQAWARDMWAFLEKIRILSGVTMSGSPDTAVDSQRYETLLKIARDLWPLWDDEHTYAEGTIVLASDTRTYQSLQISNLNKNPVSEPTWWKQFSPVDVIDNLLSTSPTAALSANQGLILNEAITNPAVASQSQKGAAYLERNGVCENSGPASILFNARRYNFDDGSGQQTAPGYVKSVNPWAAGNSGGLDTGTVAADTYYYGYAIYDPVGDVSDYIFTATLGSPAMPGNFSKKRYQGSFYFGTTEFIEFRQFEKDIILVDPILFGSGGYTSTQDFVLLTPLGVITLAYIDYWVIRTSGGGGNFPWAMISLFQTEYQSAEGAIESEMSVARYTDVNSQVRYNKGGAGTYNIFDSEFFLSGWKDINLE